MVNDRHRIVAYARRVASHPSTSPDAPAAFSERLRVPWWAWPASLALAAFLSAEVFLGAHTVLVVLPYLILLPATAAGLLALGRVRIRVAGGELHVDDAHLPVRFVKEVNVLDPAGTHALLGPLAERYAFVVQRPWVGTGVRVVLDDPADSTPYWLISSRRPVELAAAIVAARDDAAATRA